MYRVLGSVLILISACSAGGTGTQIQGQFGEKAGQEIKLEQLTGVQKVEPVQTTQTDAQGNFSIKLDIKKPGVYSLRQGEGRIFFYASPGDKIKFTFDPKNFNSYTVQGSKPSQEIKDLWDALVHRETEVAKLRQGVQVNSIEEYNAMQQKMQEDYAALKKGFEQKVVDYVNKYSGDMRTALAVQFVDPDEHGEVWDLAAEGLQKSKANDALSAHYLQVHNEIRRTAIGARAPEISLPQPHGDTLKLSELRGKYVLIDFWASWCGPCRRENPNIVNAYNNFKHRNFEIYAVSLDRSKEAWEKAIAQDQLKWFHVSDLKYWSSTAAKDYRVDGIPANFLLDPQGKIIAKNLRGEELAQTLGRLLPAN